MANSPGSINASFAPLILNGQQVNGGFSFNYNLPNMSNVTNQAYQFMQSNNAQDFGFLGSTISGSQNFLQQQVAPILAGANSQIVANQSYIPQALTMETQLANSQMGYQASLQQAGIAAQQAVAMASIQSSTASAQAASHSGGGGCFITSAVCETFNLPDDCDELTLLRKFRDEYVVVHYPGIVKEYYRCAPDIVECLNRRKDKKEIYFHIKKDYVDKCVKYIKNGKNEEAILCYSEMYFYLRRICRE